MTRVALLACAILVAALPALADAPRGDPARGKSGYVKNLCDTCHGSAGQGSRYGTRLAPNPLPWEPFVHEVRHPRAAMPRFGAEFVTDQDLADIHAYLGSMKPDPKPQDIPLLKD